MNLGVTDPQGFLDKTRREPVVFVDIHLTGRPNPNGDAALMVRQITDYMNGR